MDRALRHWIWVFGEIAGLRWVIEHSEMAFPLVTGPRLGAMGPGDRAVLYVTRGAFHNPTKDQARLAGLAKVTGEVRAERVSIGEREFAYRVSIQADPVLEERSGPAVRPLTGRLSFVGNTQVWGQYFRTSPKLIGEKHFNVLAGAVAKAARR